VTSKARFRKHERLKSRKTISELFAKSQSFGQYPLRIIWDEKINTDQTPNTFPAQVCVSVPKRNFKKAVHRNRIRRQVSESYRLQKDALYDAILTHKPQSNFAIVLMFTSKTMTSYQDIHNAISSIFRRFEKFVLLPTPNNNNENN